MCAAAATITALVLAFVVLASHVASFQQGFGFPLV